MSRSKKCSIFSLGTAAGAAVVLLVSRVAPCGTSGLLILSFLPITCPVPPSVLPPVRATGTVALALVVPQGTVIHVGDSFPVMLQVDATGDPP
jgi:uncharacterized membrane protein YccC